MTKKLYGLLSTLVTCAGTITTAVVGYFFPDNLAIAAAVVTIAVPSINDIMLLFVKTE